MIVMFFLSSSVKTENLKPYDFKKIDFNRSKDKINTLKSSAPDKRYTEAACTVSATDTTKAKAGTMCFEMSGRCKDAKDCEAVAGQINGVIPTIPEIQTMAYNHGMLMYTTGFIAYEDIPFSVNVAYNSLSTFYGYQ